MAIRIKKYIEPLSLASENQTPVIIESDAYRQVCTDLEMYTNGEILGRSFLIAGHRGAGKTTMLRQAVREVASRIQNRGQTSGQWARPLFIALHGPDLLEASTTPEEADAQSAKGAQSPDKAQTALPAAPLPPPPPTELSRFLERITSGLYVEAAHEFARCFRRRAIAVAANNREKSELLELATDLQVQLDRQPDLDRLRDYWRRAKALDPGVLFDAATDAGRGVAEVTALFSIGRVMRTFAGTTQSQMDTEANRKQESSVSLVTVDGQSLLTPLLGLASGALAWSAVPGAPVTKTIAGILTGLGAVVALKVGSMRSRASTQTWKETFIPKDDPGSLYRVLPGLIERFQRVGLFPIFVVDELDKVPHLGAKIDSLLGYMKQFVTERTFFCFVTNRSFYQQATVQVEGSAYSTFHTRFGGSVFVHYDPSDLHRYLTEIMVVDTVGTPAEFEKTIKATVMLRYLLLSRSYLHPYDLRRELSQWQDKTGMIEEKDDVLTDSGRYQREVAMQVAVEVVYNGRALAEHIRDPITAQTVLDALYYPVRRWRDGAEQLSITQKDLTDYLIERTGIKEETATFDADKLIHPDLQKTLLEEVERMLKLLCDKGALAIEAVGKVPPSIQNMLQTLPPLMETV
jgi:hypothetical protein